MGSSKSSQNDASAIALQPNTGVGRVAGGVTHAACVRPGAQGREVGKEGAAHGNPAGGTPANDSHGAHRSSFSSNRQVALSGCAALVPMPTSSSRNLRAVWRSVCVVAQLCGHGNRAKRADPAWAPFVQLGHQTEERATALLVGR